LTDPQKTNELQDEMDAISKLNHENIVQFLALVKIDGVPYLVLEWINGCDLSKYLFECHEGKRTSLSIEKKISILNKIALGMEYLHKTKTMHRDLAARNVLLSMNDEFTPKISDFGLSRETLDSDYYSVENANNVPVRWTAPEVFLVHKYYFQSDVWSFGVVCVECFDEGIVPYSDMDNQKVISFVAKKGHLEKPTSCPEKFWQEINIECFNQDWKNRISFEGLVVKFNELDSKKEEKEEDKGSQDVKGKDEE